MHWNHLNGVLDVSLTSWIISWNKYNMIFTVQRYVKILNRKDNIITFDIVVKTFKSVVMK